MKTKLDKIEGFITSLESNHLSEKQQMTLTVNPEDVMGGDKLNSNNKTCSNSSMTCQDSSNSICTNSGGNCDGTSNSKKCDNSLVAIIER